MTIPLFRTRYNSVLTNQNHTADVGNTVSTYRTMMRRLDMRKPSTIPPVKGGVLYQSSSHSEYLRMRTLRKIL